MSSSSREIKSALDNKNIKNKLCVCLENVAVNYYEQIISDKNKYSEFNEKFQDIASIDDTGKLDILISSNKLDEKKIVGLFNQVIKKSVKYMGWFGAESRSLDAITDELKQLASMNLIKMNYKDGLLNSIAIIPRLRVDVSESPIFSMLSSPTSISGVLSPIANQSREDKEDFKLIWFKSCVETIATRHKQNIQGSASEKFFKECNKVNNFIELLVKIENVFENRFTSKSLTITPEGIVGLLNRTGKGKLFGALGLLLCKAYEKYSENISINTKREAFLEAFKKLEYDPREYHFLDKENEIEMSNFKLSK